MASRLILLIALLSTAALYWSGLDGPFIFDDPWNLEPVRLWLDGNASLSEVLFPYPSLVFSRPVSMGSFALSAWLTGDTSFSFKLGNLFVHLACGVIGYAVLRRVLALDSRLANRAPLLAALVAALWLLHPLHVSTVLYAVQRMAQLATLFALSAIWVYLLARQQLDVGRTRIACFNLFVSFPLLVGLGVLSKQNAAVAPLVCLVLELVRGARPLHARRALVAFFGIFLVVPALATAALLALAPQKLLAGYAEWDFTLWQRLLTQPRALVDYIGMLLLPRGPRMGLYTDDFSVSTGLLSPPSTLLAIGLLLAISVTAIGLRKRAPVVFAGWFFFLATHAVESGFLPLEMYYEHRNYLPAFGLLLAVAGLLALVPHFQTNVLTPRKLGLLAAGGLSLMLAVATLGRVLAWQDFGTIAQLGIKTHPNSLRARFDVSVWALQNKDYPAAIEQMHYLIASDNRRHRQMGQLSLVVINCMRGDNTGSRELLRQAAAADLPRLTTFETQAFMRFAGYLQKGDCGDISLKEITTALSQILDSAKAQPDSANPVWFARFALAQILARDGQILPARDQLKKSWEGGSDKKVGIFYARILLLNGETAAAARVIAELDGLIRSYDKQGNAQLADLKGQLDRVPTDGL
jgi:protein O-mannosyl-transferase